MKLAVIIVESEKDWRGNFIPCIVKENETGYFHTSWQWGTDQAIAQKLADEYNQKMGISRTEAMTITLKSMRVEHDSISEEMEVV